MLILQSRNSSHINSPGTQDRATTESWTGKSLIKLKIKKLPHLHTTPKKWYLQVWVRWDIERTTYRSIPAGSLIKILATLSDVRYYYELHRICSIGPDLSRGREVAPARAFNRGMFCWWLVPHLSFHKYNGRESGLVITQHNSLQSSTLYNSGFILGKTGWGDNTFVMKTHWKSYVERWKI